MSQRIRTDQMATAPVAFRATNGSGDHGSDSGRGNDSGSDNRSPWEPWFFAFLAALMVAFFVLMGGKEVPSERHRATFQHGGVDLGGDGSIGEGL
jgi:hypothetical protein